jgi:exosortase/archaeosortase family protein
MKFPELGHVLRKSDHGLRKLHLPFAMKLKRVQKKLSHLIHLSIQSNHNRIVTLGLLVIILFYLPSWLGILWGDTLHTSSTPILNLGFLYLAIHMLWQARHHLSTFQATEEDQLIGHMLILGSSALFPFCLSTLSLQAVICMLILIGIAWSTWGVIFFRNYALASLLILISVYPSLTFLSNLLRHFFTRDGLEQVMAWVSSLTLQAFGQPAVAQGTLLSLSETFNPGKSVEVGSACSGFDMAFTLAGTGLILGLFLKQRWPAICLMMISGVMLALVLNIPRIMLLAFAVVYWGKDSFEFWHGPIGGQIFAALLFTIYYYLVMWVIDWKPGKG